MSNLKDRMKPRSAPAASEPSSLAGAFGSNDASERLRQLTVRVPDSLHKQIRTYALEHDLSVQDFVRSAVIRAMQA